MNVGLYSPTEIGSTQSEYSYTFSLPATKNNNRILDYANDLAKPNKFRVRRNAEVYADDNLIFSGSLLISGYKDKEYQCNLVSPKVYSLDDIFGDAKLTDIPWYVPFSGATSINEYNSTNKGVSFPLISYGVFEKEPAFSDDIANDYTPKHNLDKYNRWWIESFYPSLSALELLKKAFEWKGYNIAGDAFNDDILNDIYLSCNLSDNQYPVYNLANIWLGEVSLSATFTTNGDNGYHQELSYPYYKVVNRRAGFTSALGSPRDYEEYNFNEAVLYDILKDGNVTINHRSYIYDPGEKVIVIPADGFYNIDMSVSTTLDTTTPTFTAGQYIITDQGTGNDIEFKNISDMQKNLYETCPVEIQLVKNFDDNIELIKGKWNLSYNNGNPKDATYPGAGGRRYENINKWQTCFPHEDLYNSNNPTTLKDGRYLNAAVQRFGGQSSSTGNRNWNGGSRTSGGNTDPNTGRQYSAAEFGYVYANGEIMAYDPDVNNNFICGFSSMGIQNNQGARAVIKNGYSWTKSYTDKHDAFYNNNGYLRMYRLEGNTLTIQEEQTNKNANTYPEAPGGYFNANATTMNGSLSCMVWLNRNDVLELYQVHRAYQNEAGAQVYYSATTSVNLKISAASPRSYEMLRSINYGYDSESEFDRDLKLTNFCNDSTNVSTYVQSLIDAFNLDMLQDGKNVWFNKKKNVVNNLPAVVNIDNRVDSNEAETLKIDYPSSMAVKYQTDTEEYGYWISVPQNRQNEVDWENYGDSGYTTILINDDDYNIDNQEKSLNFSYTWYDAFNWTEVTSAGTENTANTMTISTPVISKYSYMAEGYSYDESMKHDGYGLTQRMWFRPNRTEAFVWTATYQPEKIQLYVPENVKNNTNLSYKTTEESLLKYFNLRAYLSSNYVKVNVYLTADEFNLIKNGGNVQFDDELYGVVNIDGYDPTGDNEAELTLIKLV